MMTNTRTENSTDKKAALPQDTGEALKALIKVTNSLISLAEREGQDLARADYLGFAIMQDEKQQLSERYYAMSQDFRERVEEFRGADQTQLQKLESLQARLGELTRENSEVIDRMQKQARKSTENTLFTAQELAQNDISTLVQKRREGMTQHSAS